MSNDLKTSINILQKILGATSEPTFDSLADLFEVKNGNKEIILEHLKALYSIFGKAIKELENESELN